MMFITPLTGYERRSRLITCTGLFVLLLSLITMTGTAVPIPFGEPSYTAAITGSNELVPGNVTTLTISLFNDARAPELILDPSNPVPSSPTIAYGTELTLEPGTAPVDIPATPLTIPILPPGTRVPVTFPVIVPAEATAGSYTLDLRINSQYASSIAKQSRSNVFTYSYLNTTLTVPVTIKGIVRARVDEISSSNLSSGQNGVITAKITNIGQFAGTNATAKLIPDTSDLNPYQGSYYLGTFTPGEQRTVEWRAAVQDGIDRTLIPATMVISYNDKNGNLTSSEPVTLGIPVKTGPEFRLTYEKPVIEPGGSVTVKVSYTNTGDSPAPDATVTIVPISPLSSPQGGIYLGTMLPGETKEVTYTIELERTALVKPYGILTDVKYRGDDGLISISDPMKIELTTVEPGLITQLLSPLSLVIIIGLLLIGGYLFLEREGRIVR
ncbi:MAG: hypothetical protein LUQ07_00720 [Methanospirillum sp.]|nr:hypothetical protein [Methanospirillum sp.]